MSRGLTLRRMAPSLSVEQAQHPEHVPRLQPVAVLLQRLAHRLGEPLRLGPELQHEQRPERLPRPRP